MTRRRDSKYEALPAYSAEIWLAKEREGSGPWCVNVVQPVLLFRNVGGVVVVNTFEDGTRCCIETVNRLLELEHFMLGIKTNERVGNSRVSLLVFALSPGLRVTFMRFSVSQIEELLTEYDAARVLRCATLQGDSEFVARRRERQEGVDWRRWGEDGEENRIRPANKGMGNAEFVYNWEPARLRHFPWKSETPSRNNGGST